MRTRLAPLKPRKPEISLGLSWFGARLLNLELVELGEHVFHVRTAARVDLFEADDALLVDNEERAAGHPRVLVIDVISFSGVAFGVVIGHDRMRNTTEACGKGLLAELTVRASAQNLSAFLLKTLVGQVKRGDLVRSATCESGREPA